MRKCKSLRCIFMPILGLAAVAAFSAAVMVLWNWLLPSIFGITVINFWQALGILILTRILFGGMGRHGHGRCGSGHRFHGKSGNAIREKWEAMTPQERKVFMEKHHCGHRFFGRTPFEEQFCEVNNEPKTENE